MSELGAIHRSGEDWISFLPEPLLCQVLSDLPTKIAVRTSILSTRWRNLWLSIPVLDVDIDDFFDLTTFVSLVSKYLDFSTESSLHTLKITFKRQEVDLFSIKSWIETAVLRKIQHLEVDCRMSFMCEVMPLSLYLCETLVSLRLHFVALHSFEFVSLPNLKVMHLEENVYADDEILENLVSSYETVKILRVRSQALNSLKLVLDSSRSWYNDDSEGWEVLIDAPRLKYLSIKDDQSASFVITNLCSSAKVEIGVSFNVNDIWDLDDSLERISSVGKLLTGLSNVRDMTLSGTTLKIICQYLKHEPMPQFHDMTRFQAKLYVSDLEKLPSILESCPNLQSLVLKLKGITDKEEISFSSVPKCMQSSLEYIELRRPNCGNAVVEMKVIKYLLEHSGVLKKFTLRVDCPIKAQDPVVVRELMRFRRCSSACEVNVGILEDDP
ncbi:hypothetical protein EUTSA_v10015662mg [Eutrema salsugineum]|uniref:FBD domain-containing protein n=1 Tax=Eutrema salsugineum TaxID=72664 RepID=V4LQU9_EUTSA|nr:hypothetical protein EUTSA_v10015662mg [Eutrema salsugineum]